MDSEACAEGRSNFSGQVGSIEKVAHGGAIALGLVVEPGRCTEHSRGKQNWLWLRANLLVLVLGSAADAEGSLWCVLHSLPRERVRTDF